MNSEMNLFEGGTHMSPARLQPDDAEAFALDGAEVAELRRCLHELANVLTGLAISGDLLCERLKAAELRRYAADIREGGQRGSALVCKLRRTLPGGGTEDGAGSEQGCEEPISGEFH